MNTTIKFILHASLVMLFLTLVTAVLIPVAKADHSPITSGSWLVVIDWDEQGEPELKLSPVRLETRDQCGSIASRMVEYLDAYEPDRRYVIGCAHPDDGTPLDTVIDRIIADYGPYFQPGQPV